MTRNSAISFRIALPPRYAMAPLTAFHARDGQQIAEAITGTKLVKGVALAGLPARFEIDLNLTSGHADCVVLTDGALAKQLEGEATEMARRMLGLQLDPDPFASFVVDDPVFGPLTLKQAGLRIVQAPTPYEALTWAILGQQINVSFAVTLRRSFIELAGQHHSSGLRCYPTPSAAAAIPLEELTSRKFSRSKAETILRMSKLIADGALDLTVGPTNPVEAICERLLAVKGIGPWTVNYALLRGYGHADASLHGDVAVRSAIGRLWGLEERPTTEEAAEFLKRYAPHRTMAAAHLWSSLSQPAAF